MLLYGNSVCERDATTLPPCCLPPLRWKSVLSLRSLDQPTSPYIHPFVYPLNLWAPIVRITLHIGRFWTCLDVAHLLSPNEVLYTPHPIGVDISLALSKRNASAISESATASHLRQTTAVCRYAFTSFDHEFVAH